MGIRPVFNLTKAIEILLYVSSKKQNIYNVLKVAYFADKDHLEKYGRQLCGDHYVAMSHGPVPSGMYDIVKAARGDAWCFPDDSIKNTFLAGKYNIRGLRGPDLDMLSESDIECLDEAIQNYGSLSFPELKKISHQEEAYKAADEAEIMSLESIIKSLPSGADLLEYIADC